MSGKNRNKSKPQEESTMDNTEAILAHLKIIDAKLSKLDEISDKLSIMEQRINKLESANTSLEAKNKQLEKNVNLLNKTVQVLEQGLHQNDLIISGLSTRHKTYSRAAAKENDQSGNVAPDTEKLSLKKEVMTFLNNNGFNVSNQDVANCYTIGKPNPQRPQRIVLQLSTNEKKTATLRSAKILRTAHPHVFISEFLTKFSADLYYEARKKRKEGKIINTWTSQGQVFIKHRQGNDEHVRKVASKEDLFEIIK